MGKAPGAVNVEGDIDCDSPTVIWTTTQKKPPNNILEKGMDSAVMAQGEASFERGILGYLREKKGVYMQHRSVDDRDSVTGHAKYTTTST